MFWYDRYLMRSYATQQAQGSLGGLRLDRSIPSETTEATPIMGTAIEIDFFIRDR